MTNFTDYETAKKIKELGFKEVCYGFFVYLETHKMWIVSDLIKSENRGGVVSAPMWQQVEEWLWNDHKIRFEQSSYGKEISIEIIVTDKNGFSYIHDTINKLDSPITAKNEAIKKSVEYLHEKQADEKDRIEREEYRKKNSISNVSGTGIQKPN